MYSGDPNTGTTGFLNNSGSGIKMALASDI
jgi:hypothetical protein